MTLPELFQKRLILISGKGGVGKTTLALVLGLLASRLQKRTLLVEMNSTERIAPYFLLKAIGPKEIPLSPYLTGINLDPRTCFEEYILAQIRFRLLYDAFLDNRFVTSFLNAVPGLNELLMIGKIYDLERQVKSRLHDEKLYDLMIVDGPATGHGLSSFEVPQIVADAVKVGPLKTQSQKIRKLLTDPQKCAFCAVTLSEEMPVIETNELIQTIREKLHIPLGPIFVNAFWSTDLLSQELERIEEKMPGPTDPLYPYFVSTTLFYQRARLNDSYRNILIEKNREISCITLPFLASRLERAKDLEPLVEQLAKYDL